MEDYVDTDYTTTKGEKQTFYAPKQVEGDKSQVALNPQNQSNEITTKVTQDYPYHDIVYSKDKWDRLRKNMSKSEVKSILGSPSRVISEIDQDEYIYKYTSGEGIVYFDRQMKVTKWKTP